MKRVQPSRPAVEHRLASNAMVSMANVVLGSVLVFLLYRLLLHRLGPETLGVWSLLVASISAARLSELGMAAGATRFVATARALGDERGAIKVVETATVSLLVLGAFGALIALPLLPRVLGMFMAGEGLAVALQTLPWALVAFAIGLAGGAAQSALDGCQRMDLRVWMALAGQMVLLGASVLLTRGHGLAGVAIAQVLQSLVVLVGSWALLRGQIRGLPLLPRRWDYATFRRIVGYSALFQFNSLMLLLLDPLVKITLTRFGGLSATAYFDMANQLVQRLRMLPVAAIQALVPAMAHAEAQGSNLVRDLYVVSYRVTFAATVAGFCLAAALVPVISAVWIGHEEGLFMGAAWICLAGWALNCVGTPAYFGNIGAGTLVTNTVGHVVQIVLCSLLGWWGGTWGAHGVTAAYAIAIAVGGLYIQIVFEKRLGYVVAVPAESRRLLMISLLSMALCLAVDTMIVRYFPLETGSPAAQVLRIVTVLAVFCVLVGPNLWSHPLRRLISERALDRFRRQPDPS
jgi:O-antigen/teichoic acid export membrane protein